MCRQRIQNIIRHLQPVCFVCHVGLCILFHWLFCLNSETLFLAYHFPLVRIVNEVFWGCQNLRRKNIVFNCIIFFFIFANSVNKLFKYLSYTSKILTLKMPLLKNLKIPKGQPEAVIWRTITNWKKKNVQTTIYKILHKSLKMEQNEFTNNVWWTQSSGSVGISSST